MNLYIIILNLAATSKIFDSCNEQIVSAVIAVSKYYYLTLNHFLAAGRKELKKMYDDVYELSVQAKDMKDNLYKVIVQMQDDALDSGRHYIQVVNAVCEICNCTLHIYKPALKFLKNNRTSFSDVQIAELTELNEELSVFFNLSLHTLKNRKYENLPDEIHKDKMTVLTMLDDLQRKQLKRIKRQEVSTPNSILYLHILSETKNLTLFTVNLIKANRNFYGAVSEKRN